MEEVSSWNARGQAIMNESSFEGVFSDDNLDMSLIARDTARTRSIGLQGAIEECTTKLKFRGLTADDLRATMDGYSLEDNLMDLMENGQRSFMTSKFVPNAGKGYQQSRSQRENSALCTSNSYRLRVMRSSWQRIPSVKRIGVKSTSTLFNLRLHQTQIERADVASICLTKLLAKAGRRRASPCQSTKDLTLSVVMNYIRASACATCRISVS